jgi:phage terminase large subunit-like protein
MVKTGARRFNVLACGRRWGKTVLAEDLILAPALQGYPVAYFAPTYKMLAEVWRDLEQLLRPVASRVNSQENRVELLTRGVVDMWSLENPDVARGRKYKRIVVDEAAMIRHLEEAWTQVLRPTLMDFEGDGWFMSTPKGRNYFARLFGFGGDDDQPDWRCWQMPTSANPFIRPSEVAEMRRNLPERIFAQEIEAAFLEDAGGVFRRVMDAATATLQDRAEPDHQYVIGVDWGRSVDYTVFAVVDVGTRECVCVDRSNKVEYAVQRGRLLALAERFHPLTIYAEENAMGAPIVEQLQRDGLPVQPFVTTNATKAQIVDSLALAFERGDLRILNDRTLIGELQAFEATRLPSGLMRYAAPEGEHDDCVMSLALAWQGATLSPYGGIWV